MSTFYLWSQLDKKKRELICPVWLKAVPFWIGITLSKRHENILPDKK